MLRQDQSPIEYQATRRPDNSSILTTGRAGEVIPIAAGPLLRGDSASGRIDIQAQLAEMPKPLENLVVMRAQSWIVPRPALPQFEGTGEYNHAYEGTSISKLGGASRTPPSLFDTVASGAIAAAQSSELFRALGIALRASTEINTDYIDAYNLIQNFRLAAHSSKMTRYDYYSEDATTSLELKPAFWPVNRMHNIVPDYEEALVKGSLELDVTAGSLPVHGIGIGTVPNFASRSFRETGGTTQTESATTTSGGSTNVLVEEDPNNTGYPAIFAQLAAQTITTSLADIDKARTTEAMAKARAMMEGTNYSGFNNDDVIVSTLMQGFVVPAEHFNRPILLDSKTTVFGMTERHATDAANLDDSSTTGVAAISLSLNIPRMDYGGVYMTTVEVMPERLFERQEDPYLPITAVASLPNALRDVQNTLPVDTVDNGRVDTAHTTPAGQYGFEPMNAKWRREFTRLGGEFRQLTPGTPSTTSRTAIWQADYVDPTLNSDHWLCPHPFPQDVFSAPSSDVIIISATQQMAITGITQFGDDLVEDNSEFADTQAEQP
jgi:hypothetical protein